MLLICTTSCFWNLVSPPIPGMQASYKLVIFKTNLLFFSILETQFYPSILSKLATLPHSGQRNCERFNVTLKYGCLSYGYSFSVVSLQTVEFAACNPPVVALIEFPVTHCELLSFGIIMCRDHVSCVKRNITSGHYFL